MVSVLCQLQYSISSSKLHVSFPPSDTVSRGLLGSGVNVDIDRMSRKCKAFSKTYQLLSNHSRSTVGSKWDSRSLWRFHWFAPRKRLRELWLYAKIVDCIESWESDKPDTYLKVRNSIENVWNSRWAHPIRKVTDKEHIDSVPYFMKKTVWKIVYNIRIQ